MAVSFCHFSCFFKKIFVEVLKPCCSPNAQLNVHSQGSPERGLQVIPELLGRHLQPLPRDTYYNPTLRLLPQGQLTPAQRVCIKTSLDRYSSFRKEYKQSCFSHCSSSLSVAPHQLKSVNQRIHACHAQGTFKNFSTLLLDIVLESLVYYENILLSLSLSHTQTYTHAHTHKYTSTQSYPQHQFSS